MADKKISQLTALAAANLAPSTDVLAIVDTSATETKKIVAQDLINGVLNVASAVGIGTASPNCKFEVKGGSAISTLGNSYTNAGLLHQYSSSILLAIGSDGTNPVFQGVNATNNTAKDITLQPLGGNLGLGVTPSAWSTLRGLQVGNASIAGFQNFAYLNSNVFYDGSAWKYISDGFAAKYDQVNSVHAWYTAPSGTAGNTISFTQAMTLNANGSLVLNSTTNVTSLVGQRSGSNHWFIGDVNGALGSGAGLMHYTYGADPIVFYTNGTERGRFTAGGNLLVGRTTDLAVTPRVSIENTNFGLGINTTNGGSNEAVRFYNAGTVVGSIATDGSSTTYNTSSDRRLKENIVPADDAGPVIDAIEVVKHDWKAGGHTRYGMIAQDLHMVAPEAVSVGDADDAEDFKNPWGVDYSKLVPMLVKELQSVRARLAALEAK